MLSLKFLTTRKTPPLVEEGHITIHQRQVLYTLHRKKGRRRITLYIEPSGKLRLNAPLRTRMQTIDQFLLHSQDWLAGKLAEVQKNSAPHFPQTLNEGATVYYLGDAYQLTVTNDTTKQTCRIKDGWLEINLPQSAAVSDAELQEEIRLEIILWYKKQARNILKERTELWATQMGLKYRSIKITSPTRQWGSCSAQNDIRLNWRVMMAPLFVIDYLIVHELAHIRHKNHSVHFWNYVANYIPDYQTRQQTLKHMDAGFSI